MRIDNYETNRKNIAFILVFRFSIKQQTQRHQQQQQHKIIPTNFLVCNKKKAKKNSAKFILMWTKWMLISLLVFRLWARFCSASFSFRAEKKNLANFLMLIMFIVDGVLTLEFQHKQKNCVVRIDVKVRRWLYSINIGS